jgi:hypothetical protein
MEETYVYFILDIDNELIFNLSYLNFDLDSDTNGSPFLSFMTAN